MTGWHHSVAYAVRARVAIAQGQRERAELDVHEALTCAADSVAYLYLSDILEIAAELVIDIDTHQAARLFGAAGDVRQSKGILRFKVYDAGYQTSVTKLRAAMDENDFDAAWAEGAAMSIEEAIAYAQRGHGERKRPASGWAALTPAELDVVRLVTEGLTNKDVATRLFVSPRTVQAHLAHVFTKLGVTTRTQLAQEATRHASSDA